MLTKNMLMTVEERRELISRVLTPRNDVTANSAAIADRALWSWERIAFHITPLIGQAGFVSLYARAVHLALPHCASLNQLKHAHSTDELFQALKADLSAVDPTQAEACSNLLLNKFTDLVSSMVGDSLMAQILRSAWAEHSTLESVREIKK